MAEKWVPKVGDEVEYTSKIDPKTPEFDGRATVLAITPGYFDFMSDAPESAAYTLRRDESRTKGTAWVAVLGEMAPVSG